MVEVEQWKLAVLIIWFAVTLPYIMHKAVWWLKLKYLFKASPTKTRKDGDV